MEGLRWTARSVRACASEERVPRVEETGRAGSADELEARHTTPTWLRCPSPTAAKTQCHNSVDWIAIRNRLVLLDFAVAARPTTPSSVREESGPGGLREAEWERVGARSIARSTLTVASTVARPAMQDGGAMGMGRTLAVKARAHATRILPCTRCWIYL